MTPHYATTPWGELYMEIAAPVVLGYCLTKGAHSLKNKQQALSS